MDKEILEPQIGSGICLESHSRWDIGKLDAPLSLAPIGNIASKPYLVVKGGGLLNPKSMEVHPKLAKGYLGSCRY